MDRDEVISKVRACVADYKKESGRNNLIFPGKYPDRLIVVPDVYKLLLLHDLAVQTMSARVAMDLHARGGSYLGRDLIPEITEGHATPEIGLYDIENLPSDLKSRARGLVGKIKLPIVLCRSGWVDEFKGLSVYNLEADLASLAL